MLRFSTPRACCLQLASTAALPSHPQSIASPSRSPSLPRAACPSLDQEYSKRFFMLKDVQGARWIVLSEIAIDG